MLLSFLPHMHLRGKDFRYEAIYPDGRRETLLSVPQYDFNWQHLYQLKEPKLIPKGSTIRCVALDAQIGVYSRCNIHASRPSVCREVDASWEFGAASHQCDRARAAHGLPPLGAADWRWRDHAGNDDRPDDNGNSPSPPRLPPLAA